MKKNKSSISKSNSYEQMGEFWGSHDLTDFLGATKKNKFDVDIVEEKIYCILDKEISGKVQSLATKRGILPDILVNKILQNGLKGKK